MHISWLGNTCIRLQAKPFDKDVDILIDPYKQKTGTVPRNLTSDIVLFTRGEDESITLSGKPFIVASPGESEIKGVLVTAIQEHEIGKTLFRVDVEQMSIGHLGMLSKPLHDEQIAPLVGVDILFLPVGNPESLEIEQSSKLINILEPRIVIPIAFHSDNDPKAMNVEIFLKAIGAKTDTPEKKVIIKKKDLPEEDMRVIVLSKE
jgi:L-ascorbate metabolism protein UlaG (beta-lactamase superfamily)